MAVCEWEEKTPGVGVGWRFDLGIRASAAVRKRGPAGYAPRSAAVWYAMTSGLIVLLRTVSCLGVRLASRLCRRIEIAASVGTALFGGRGKGGRPWFH